MKSLGVILIALAAYAYGHDHLLSPRGMQGIKVYCDDQSKIDFMAQYKGHPCFNFEKVPQDFDMPWHVFVTAEEVKKFKANLKNNNINFEVFVEDLGEIIDQGKTSERYRGRRTDGSLSLDHFPRYSEIKRYIRYLISSHPDVVEPISLGKSYESRDLMGVKISSGGSNKPALFIDAGIHAREWIAPSTALYAIQQLVENSTNYHIFKNIDIYIIPSVNPDGYTFSQMAERTRLWRKTRSNYSQSECIGADGNRNFGYHWMATGASANPCSDIYAGYAPFSESETRGVRDFLKAKNKTIKVYVSLHSYGNYLLHPWGWKKGLPKRTPALTCVAKELVEGISKVRGTIFKYGSSTNTLSAGAGSSDDWSLAVGGVKLAYTMELGYEHYGFASPTYEIEPVGQEFMEAVKVYAKYIEGKICQDEVLEDEYEFDGDNVEYTTESTTPIDPALNDIYI